MIKRIIVAFFGIPLILFVILSRYNYNLPFLLFLIILNGLCLNEMHHIFELKNIKLNKIYFITCGTLIILSFYFQIYYLKNENNIINLFFILSVCIYLIRFIFTDNFNNTILKISFFTFGLFYISYLSGYFLLLKNLTNGSYFLFLIVLLIWFNDSFAYFCGLLFGKKKLGIKASPNKSYAGIYGALFFSVISVFISEQIFRDHLTLSLFKKIFIGIIFGIIAILSDLIESVLKRSAGLKDSGNLFPGHGGVLDIFDGWFFTIPLFYFYIKFFG